MWFLLYEMFFNNIVHHDIFLPQYQTSHSVTVTGLIVSHVLYVVLNSETPHPSSYATAICKAKSIFPFNGQPVYFRDLFVICLQHQMCADGGQTMMWLWVNAAPFLAAWLCSICHRATDKQTTRNISFKEPHHQSNHGLMVCTETSRYILYICTRLHADN